MAAASLGGLVVVDDALLTGNRAVSGRACP